ncbi:MAG: ABC transporter ATP-binding protein [Gammaproteobacteria bacterium]
MTGTPLLECSALETAVPGRLLCTDLNLAAAPGDRIALLGPNGSGKTTLLHTLAGLNPMRNGTVTLLGKHLAAWKRRHLARHLGLSFQEPGDALPSNVLETTLMGRHPHLGAWSWEGPEDARIARAALADVGLAGLEARTTDSLSGGERQRLALAVLLTQAPDVLLLDEPANHLDPAQQVQILKALDTHIARSQACAIMSLHDVNLALRFCNRALLLFGDGNWVEGPVAEVINEEHLERLYGHPMHSLQGPGGPAYLPA